MKHFTLCHNSIFAFLSRNWSGTIGIAVIAGIVAFARFQSLNENISAICSYIDTQEVTLKYLRFIYRRIHARVYGFNGVQWSSRRFHHEYARLGNGSK